MTYAIERLPEVPYPLSEIPDPPESLWISGAFPSPNTTLLAVVGSRKYTSYGKEACELLVRGLSGYDIAIVSGLAIGMDTIAHEAALAGGLKTIAVPGSGLHPSVLYPRTNVGLAERILAKGGCLLSEFAPDFKATPYSFPQRNRIMAGISKATLLIEASERSGTLITARLASEYDRDVLVVPGSIFSANSYGTHQFLKLGATPVTTSEDILIALGITPRSDEEEEAASASYEDLLPEEREIMELLTEPLHRDIIIARLNKSAPETNIILMRMEIGGLITETAEGIRRA